MRQLETCYARKHDPETNGAAPRLLAPREEPGMKKLLLVLVAAAIVLFSAALYADNYPSRPITIVAVFGPGSASDTLCRIIADPLSATLCRSSSTIALARTARSRRSMFITPRPMATRS
jgi:hypothetical protein